MKIKTTLLNFFFFLIKITPSKLSCFINNIRQIVMGRDSFFFYDSKIKLFKVKETNKEVYFPDKLRGILTYSYGIKSRATQLADTYSLELVNFCDNDIFIDCGANFGDMYNWIIFNKFKLKYISFEPSPREFKCLKLNCSGQINNQIALSDKEGFLKFYVKSDTGDSSLIEPAEGYNSIITVKTITLNNYFKKNKIEKVKFLKVEGEGSEPEILQGANEVVKQIQYIGVDGSPERGLKKETTIDFAIDFLKKNDFSIIKSNINSHFAKVLFKNNKL